MPSLLRSELRAPMHGQSGAAARWTVTFFPQEANVPSKNGSFDVAKVVGFLPERMWLEQLCHLLLQLPPCHHLLGLKPKRFLDLYHLSRDLGKVEQAHPHQLRHGGASMDAMAGRTDADLLDRGSWATQRSILRYRKPARYIRCLGLLSAEQVKLAKLCPRLIVEKVKALLLLV